MKIFCILAASAALLAPRADGAPRPNILLIVSEDNGPELGCYGDPFARTPNLDRLAAEGVRFERAYVAQAGCSQSRASYLTGLYPHQHGQIGLATWGFRLYREDTPNIVRSLKEAGYRTGIIGKLHVNPATAFPFDFAEIPNANFARKNLGDYAKHAKAFIAAGDAPFLLSVNYPDAHAPWLRQADGLPKSPQTGADVKVMPYMGIDPPAMREMIADHYNCMSRLDSLIGDLLALLDRTGKANNTLVIYLGDHGADMLRGKRTCYEGGVRVPLIIRWPGQARPQVRRELVSTIDLMPTLLAAAGVAPVPGLPGLPLQPLLAGEPVKWRTHLFTEYHTHGSLNYFPQRTARNDRYKLIENLLPGSVNPDYHLTLGKLQAEVRQHGPKGALDLAATIANAAPDVRTAYATMRQPPRYELYDLKTDPHEFRNLAGATEHAARLAELARALDDWRRETRDPLLNPAILERLTAEVTAVTSKTSGKQLVWSYPDYFFGREPVKTDSPSKGKRKKNR
ncbi:MAG: sulfatase [Verrucomicrobia bacterium]|nr:sulfatase [Verrucomicrobiota bacterium]